MDNESISKKFLSDLVVYSKYAKHLPDKNRRETWEEVCDRLKDLYCKKFPQIKDDIEKSFLLVKEKKVFPSMRGLQFGGNPIELNNARLYNCSFTAITSWKDFSEIMFLLLSGCFHPDTKVKVKGGPKKISEITENDEVMSYDFEKEQYIFTNPLNAVKNPKSKNKKKIKLVLENDEVVFSTLDHEFFTTNRGWVKAKDLTENDDIKNIYDDDLKGQK